MTLPGGIELIRVRGYYWGDTGAGADRIVRAVPSITALTNVAEHGWLRAERETAVTDDNGYWFLDLLPTNHPDFTPFQWTVKSNYAPRLTIEVPFDSPLADVGGGVVMRSIWLTDAATDEPPPPTASTYYTAAQVRELLANYSGGAGGGGYTHTQPVAQSVWTVVHNFGRFPIAWSLYDALGAECTQYTVQHLDNDTSRVSMDTPSAGLIRLI